MGTSRIGFQNLCIAMKDSFKVSTVNYVMRCLLTEGTTTYLPLAKRMHGCPTFFLILHAVSKIMTHHVRGLANSLINIGIAGILKFFLLILLEVTSPISDRFL